MAIRHLTASPGRAMAMRILIAEDEPNIVLSLEFLLKEADYEVAVAREGAQALAQVAAFRPHLIVLDIMLPVINGFDLSRRIRDTPEFRDVKILMLTARGRQTEIERGFAAGADAYKTKPFATRELVRLIADLLADASK